VSVKRVQPEWTSASRLVVSVMGPHAGEESSVIFRRKIQDIATVGQTFWLVRSLGATPDAVRRLCSGADSVYVVFVEPSTSGGAQPTRTAVAASEYSIDRTNWVRLPRRLGPVTGKIDRGAYALCLDDLRESEPDVLLDLWAYGSPAAPHEALRTRIGRSTVCAIRHNTEHDPTRMRSRYRLVKAYGRLRQPFSCWLRRRRSPRK